MPRSRPAILLVLTLAASSVLHAQSTPPAAPPTTPPSAPPTTNPAPAEKPASAPDPSLDELLGLPKSEPKKPLPPTPQPADAGALPDPQKSALDRKLTDEEAQEAFKEAVRQMDEVAQRLEKARDTGLTTQRLQEDILRKLDALIKHQKQQQQQGGSSSSSSSSSQQNQQNQQQPSQPQGGKPSPANQRDGTGDRAGTPPPGQDPQLKARLDQTRAAWGALPERLREAFTQGMDDYYSRLYQSMTEEYYRKTAESAGK